MSSLELYRMLDVRDPGRGIETKVVMSCAPFLKGLKTATTINICPEECRQLQQLILGTKIRMIRLAARRGKCLILLYRREALRKYLSRPEIREFLTEFGYEETYHAGPDAKGCNVEAVLRKLRQRIGEFSQEAIGFPHEIGIFFNYPLADIRDYITNQGRNAVLTGYWQVYHEPEQAKRIFAAWNKARETAAREFIQGKSIAEIGVAVA